MKYGYGFLERERARIASAAQEFNALPLADQHAIARRLVENAVVGCNTKFSLGVLGYEPPPFAFQWRYKNVYGCSWWKRRNAREAIPLALAAMQAGYHLYWSPRQRGSGYGGRDLSHKNVDQSGFGFSYALRATLEDEDYARRAAEFLGVAPPSKE